MGDPKIDAVNQWLLKVDHDFRSGQQLLKTDPPLLDTAVYHYQ